MADNDLILRGDALKAIDAERGLYSQNPSGFRNGVEAALFHAKDAIAAVDAPAPELPEAHEEQLGVWADELMADLALNGLMDLVNHEYDTKVGARRTIMDAMKSANQAKVPISAPDKLARLLRAAERAYDVMERFGLSGERRADLGAAIAGMKKGSAKTGVIVHDTPAPAPDKVARLVDALAVPEVRALVEAVAPFAACADELDAETASGGREWPDDEWAKFRLLVGDYRRARAALAPFTKGGDA
jgi:hypothetical protein